MNQDDKEFDAKSDELKRMIEAKRKKSAWRSLKVGRGLNLPPEKEPQPRESFEDWVKRVGETAE